MPRPRSNLRSELASLAGGPSLTTGVLAMLLVLAWMVWGAVVEVSVRVDSASAVVSQADSVFHVDATRGGTIEAVPMLRSGRSVETGQLLVELDASSVDIEIEATKNRTEGLGRARSALVAQRDAEAEGVDALEEASEGTLAVGAAEVRRARVASNAAARELRRATKLASAGFIAEGDKEGARNDALTANAEVALQRASLDRAPKLQHAALAKGRATVAGIEREIAQTDLALAEAKAELARLSAERKRYEIRAPSAGVLGAVEGVRVGAMLTSGQRVASVVANAELHVEAEFPAASAIGRISVGQEARVRIVGFPWTRFGQLRARVTDVASEAVDGNVRIELAIEDQPSDLVLEHGQPAEVAIAVEEATPWSIMMRYVGDRLR